MTAPTNAPQGVVDWYARRDELRGGQIFRTADGSMVQLDRGVPGDATKWYVLDWDGGWFHYDSTIEPGDLIELLDAESARIQGGAA
jgi:hypothetical protein